MGFVLLAVPCKEPINLCVTLWPDLSICARTSMVSSVFFHIWSQIDRGHNKETQPVFILEGKVLKN